MNKKGFTLIEILIVVGIIAVLASIILVGLGAFRGRGRDARRIADLRSTQNALELYYTKNKAYPGSNNWSDLTTALTGAGIGVAQIPDDPLAPSSHYQYGFSTDFQNYALGAVLEDSSNPALASSPRGTLTFPGGGTFNCTNPKMYCVQF